MQYSQYYPDLAYPEWYGRDVKCLQKTRITKAGEMLECQSFPLFLNPRIICGRKRAGLQKKCRLH